MEIAKKQGKSELAAAVALLLTCGDMEYGGNIPRLLVYLIADRVGIVPRRSDQKIQRLLPGIPGAMGHHVIQLPVRLGMELVKYHRMDIQPMLRIRLRRQYLIEAVQRSGS